MLLLLPTHTYRAPDFMAAAGRLGVDVTVVSEQASTMEGLQPSSLLTLDFLKPEEAAERALRFFEEHPFQAVVPVDEETAVVAAAISKMVGLPFNPPQAAVATRLKHVMRDALSAAHVLAPDHRLFSTADDPEELAGRVRYPCVLKPVFLSASRGVMRADDEQQFQSWFERLRILLRDPEVVRRGGRLAEKVLVEGYVPGSEVALEGLLSDGELQVLAIFDKPDPLEGPFFEETIYVTPSRLPEELQRGITETAERAARALGLRHGPIHAELRVNERGVWVIEIAGRSIGGLCARALRFGLGLSLEELVIRHALGFDVRGISREDRAAGVMMIPIPRAGVLEEVRGLPSAEAVTGIEEIAITAHPGKLLVPLPEGSSYLGFIFAKGTEPGEVEQALREAFSRLEFRIAV
ncbi:MAG: ATP-grasp domain-containing protein [Vicinamibacteria bacterium]